MAFQNPQDQERRPAIRHGLLRQLTPHQIAEMIRALDSRLDSIEYDDSAGEPVLIYRFELAGRQEEFVVSAATGPLTSVADLYPEAGACERELQHRFGLEFRPPDAQSARERSENG